MMTRTHIPTPSIGELLDLVTGQARGDRPRRGGLHITGEAVWGGSKEAGSFHEEAFMARLDDSGRRACRRAVNEAFERGRAILAELRRERRELTLFERQCVQITNSAIRVYNALLRMEKRFRGRVFPSYEKIAEWATVSRATVHRALSALEEIGLLARLRRYDYQKSEKVGARSTQTSNAYRMELPRLLRELIGARYRPAPVPQDELQRQHERVADHAAMLSSLSKADYLRATIADRALASACVSLFEGVERQSLR